MAPGRMKRRLLPLTLATAWFLIPTAEASAENCFYTGGSPGSWHQASGWDCGHVPTSADDAIVPSFKNVTVGSDAVAGGVVLTGGFGNAITFSNEATLATGTLDVSEGTVQGFGTLTVSGAFTKSGDGGETMFILDSADVVLNGDSTHAGGQTSICQSGDPPSDPTLHINADLTIEETLNTANVFNCSSSGARVRIGPSGHLIQAKAGLVTSQTAIDNDGTITVQQGTLFLTGGTAHSFGATSDGDYLADAGATLELTGSPPLIGATARFGGAGTIRISALDVETAPGATIDPATLQVGGVLRMLGSAPVTLNDLDLTGGVIDSDRPVTVTGDMDVTGGVLQRNFTLTVAPTGSFSKTGFGTFSVTNFSDQGSADLVLNADGNLDGGNICASGGSQNPDQPGLYINQDFTIGSGASSGAFQCGPQFGNTIHLGGPSGHLSKTGAGTTNFNDLDVAGGTLSVASGQTFVFPNTYAQSGGVTEIASGGTLQANPVLTGGVLRGAGQLTGNLTNTSGTVRPGTSPGTLNVTGNYSQGPGGVLGIDVDGTAQGTQFDHLSVGGAASLDGTVAISKGAGFDPATSDTFQFLTSASRTGNFDALTGSLLPSGKGYALDYPGAPDFGSELTVTATPGSVAPPTLTDTDPDSFADDNAPEVKGTAPAGSTVALYSTSDCSGPPAAVGSAAAFASPGLTVSVADNSTTTFRATATVGSDTSPCSTSSIEYIEDSGPADVSVDGSTSQSFLDSLTRLRGSLIMDNIDTRPNLIVPNLTQLGEDLTVTDNDALGTISLDEMGTVGGTVEISGNTSAGTLSLGELGEVAGELTIEDNGDATVELGSVDQVVGDLTLESTGAGTLDIGAATVGGDADIEAADHDGVTGATANGSTTVTNIHPEATMTAALPAGAFGAPIPFTITHLDPASLPPGQGTGAGGGAATIDPVAAWQFAFDVPTLNEDASLTFEVQLDGLDPATQADFLAALDSGTATLATRGDAPGGTYQAFPLCTGGAVPSADGCVSVTKLDSNGQPTSGTPDVVRFSGVVGHFSTWAVALVTDEAAPNTTITAGPKRKSKSKSATFVFNSSEPGSTFECKLDGASFGPCTSPHKLKAKNGKHTFSVRAIDAAGNADPSPATRTWKVKPKRR